MKRRMTALGSGVLVIVLLATLPAPAQEQADSAPRLQLPALLSRIEAQSEATLKDLAEVNVGRWRANGRQKDEARNRAESLERNLRGALPALIEAVRQSPDAMAPIFRLYRNLSALHDVMAVLAESAGVANARDDYEALAERARFFDEVRRALAEEIERMAAARDQELGRLRAADRTRTTPPKKIIIDDRQPAPKPRKP